MTFKKGRGLVRSGFEFDPEQVFGLVKAYQADYPVTKICSVLGVSVSGYYAWRNRAPSWRR